MIKLNHKDENDNYIKDTIIFKYKNEILMEIEYPLNGFNIGEKVKIEGNIYIVQDVLNDPFNVEIVYILGDV